MNIVCKIKNGPRRMLFLMKRFFNQRHRYDFPSENEGWKKIGTGPVFGDASTGTVFDPFVFAEDNRFIMVVSERSSGNLIRLESFDGVIWNYENTLFTGMANTWESVVNRASVLFHDGIYRMWYTGQNNGVSKIGYAESSDGKNFSRKLNDPVLYATMKEEGVSVMNPHVIWNSLKQKYQMWYAAGEDYEPDVLFYAESADGMSWTKCEKPVLTPCWDHDWECAKVGGCFVDIDKNGLYTMYYIGYQNIDVARICMATSSDGVLWVRSNKNLLLSPSRNAWDSDAVYKPSVLTKGSKMYLWYNGRSAHNEYIGLAVKE